MRNALLRSAALLLASTAGVAQERPQVEIESRSIPVIEVDGLRFRDLDRNGRLTPYEDWRLSPEARTADLVGRMTLAEKAGAVMHGTLPGIGGTRGHSNIGYDLAAARELIVEKHITTFISKLVVSPRPLAEQHNGIQAIAESGRLGIPVMVSTDPRHHFKVVIGASLAGPGFSKWPEALGFASLRDPELVRRFADIARVEYRATGIHQALSPQADLATEPRWSRGTATFGSNPALARSMVEAYVVGFQGSSQGAARNGVLATVKHWVGYGAAIDGWDSHSYYGRYARVDAESFKAHVEPFLGAFAANVGGVMPTYSIVQGAIVDGRPIESVGAGFNRELLTGLLRGTHGFRGLIVSDWAITNDCGPACRAPTAERKQASADLGMPWGVEELTRLERFAKGMNAGLDQFGGVAEPELIVEAVRKSLIAESRLDESVARIMAAKFALGLFDDPFVDPEAAARTVNPPAVEEESLRVQSSSQVLLKDPRRLLPLKSGTRVVLRGVDPAAAAASGLTVVEDPKLAQVGLVRMNAPFEQLHPHHLIGSHQHEGRLDFRAGDPGLEAVQAMAPHMPVIAAIFIDRPTVMGPLNDAASAILANFGVSDAALMASVTGRAPPRGKLPFELPSSMAAVEAQDPARPDDSRQPLYAFGAGIVAPAAAQSSGPIQLWRLKCGADKDLDLGIFSDTYLYSGRKKSFAYSCYLIRHGESYMLWDTGLPGTDGTRIVDQLHQIGVSADQVRFVGISHNHHDHIGQVADFPNATLLIGREDFEASSKGGAVSDGSRDGAERLAPWIRGGGRVEAIGRDRDVFGDGSVVILGMPGHTPGHQSLLVRLPKTGSVLLSGDLYHFTENRKARGVPIFNTHRADTLASMDRFEAIARTLKARVIIQHEPADIAKLPRFPQAAD